MRPDQPLDSLPRPLDSISHEVVQQGEEGPNMPNRKATPLSVRKGRPTTLKGRWKLLVNDMGGVDKLAEAVGVTTKTVWRWGTFRDLPGRPAAKLVTQIALARGLPDPMGALEPAELVAMAREMDCETALAAGEDMPPESGRKTPV